MTGDGGKSHGACSDTSSKEPGNEGDFSLPGIRGFVRHPRPGRRDEHVRPIPATRDVRYSDERVPAIRCSRVEYSGPHPIQVREPRGYLQDWMMFHMKPHVYCALEPDSEQRM